MMPPFPFGRRKQKRPPHRYGAAQIAMPAVQESVAKLQTGLDSWQKRVLGYSAIVPEVMTGYSFVHNTMDLVTFEIQRWDRAEADWVEDNTPEMQDIERRINTAFTAGRAAALMHLIEEVFILVERRPDNRLHFETLAPTEIQKKNGQTQKRILGDDGKETWAPIEPTTTIIRIYTPDPLDRFQASGPHKPLLGLLESMALEVLRDQSDSKSVLAGNGIMYIPTEILPDEVDTIDASDTPGSRKGFESALEFAMTATITDRNLAESVVPITLYGPGEQAENIRHIIPRKESAYETNVRTDGYVKRYAHSIDLPAQVIEGIGEANHWGDWKVDENTWAYHLLPRGQRIADALYKGLIAAIIKALGLDPAIYRLVPDPQKAMAKSDMSRAATDAYKLGAIKPESYIEAIGFDASDLSENAEENLYILSGADILGEVGSASSLPDRSAASKNPATIMRQVAKAAAIQQNALDRIMRRYLKAVAEDAAKAGRQSDRDQTAARREAAAAGDIPFLGYEPGVYFAKYRDELEAATNAQLSKYLNRIATLTNLNRRNLDTIWRQQFKQRAQIVAAEADRISRSIEASSYRSGRAAFIGDAPIRTLTSLANGGVNGDAGDASNTRRPTVSGEDSFTTSSLQEAAGSFATIYTWTVGAPTNPFEPHQELDGQTWSSWEEFDSLSVPDSAAWLPGTVFFPGDHSGCQCDYDVTFLPMSEVAQ